MDTPRIRVPREPVNKGEVIQIKTLMPHPMETGLRIDRSTGGIFPRQIIHTFVCKYNGDQVFRVDFSPAVAANPYLAFYTVATESGELEFTWIDDAGEQYTETAAIHVV